MRNILDILNPQDRLFRLTVVFVSASRNQSDYVISNRFTYIIHNQSNLYITAATEFFNSLNVERKKQFLSVCLMYVDSCKEVQVLLDSIKDEIKV